MNNGKYTRHLFVIDAQHDFCNPTGALFVAGADEDMKRLAGWITRNIKGIDAIHATLDSHQVIHIAHPAFWSSPTGDMPAPFTTITVDDVKTRKWKPRAHSPELEKRVLEYVEGLQASSRYDLTIWPPHCRIGSLGGTLVPDMLTAFETWSIAKKSTIDYVSKGSNVLTEHYSAVKAEVPDPLDPSTQLNSRLVNTIKNADEIVVAGEAGSHCLANTVRDIASAFNDSAAIAKIVLLTDATSPVTGFEDKQAEFIKDMTALGMRTATTADYLS